jgi:hypothetical protein
VSLANKTGCVVGLLLVAAWTLHRDARPAAAQRSTTSPPADDVLTKLVLRQPVADVEILALGEHVDYWDQLGWRDPFSSEVYSSRQSNYDAVHVNVPPSLTLPQSTDVVVAINEGNLVSEVRRGENAGRTLRHSAVQRSLTLVGTLSPDKREWSTSASVIVAPEWKAANLRIMSFLQERESRRLVGAGAASGHPHADTQ